MLTIDIGNTRIKWLLFLADKIQDQGVISYRDNNFENQLKAVQLPLTQNEIAISHVAGADLKKRLILWLEKKGIKQLWFAKTADQQCGLRNSYLNIEKMGVDRWLAMLAGFTQFNSQPPQLMCVVDCGTAITLDIVDSNGQHLGGLIMPGFQTMCESLFRKTGNIDDKVIELNRMNGSALLANETFDAIKQGCAQLIVNGLEGVLNKHQKTNTLLCLVTGGDGKVISKMLKIENNYQPYLVQYGLLIAMRDAQENGMLKKI